MTSWKVTAPAGLTDHGFDRRVDQLRRDNDGYRVLVVRQLDTVDERGGMTPTDAVWRYPDGREMPVLALEFQGVDRRTLHAIAGVGRRVQVKGYLGAITRAGSRRPNAELPMVITAPEKVVVTNLELVYPGASGGSPATSPPPMSAMHRE